jgi:hypothetical protein
VRARKRDANTLFGWLLPHVGAPLPRRSILNATNPPNPERTDMHYLLEAHYAHAVAWQKTQRTHAATRQQLPSRRGLLRLRVIRPGDPVSTKTSL